MSFLQIYNFFFNLITLNFERVIIFFSFLFTIVLFYLVTTSFMRIIVTIFQLILASVVISSYDLDFFSGFLLVAELPILVIASVFYFQKFGIKFDSLYTIKSAKISMLLKFVCVFLSLFFFFFTKLLQLDNIYYSCY